MPAGWNKVQSDYCTISGLDPYVNWALGAGRASFLGSQAGQKQPRMPILVQLSGIDANRFAQGHGLIHDDDLGAWSSAVRVPAIYRHPPQSLAGATYCTALVTEEFFKLLTKSKNRKMLDHVPRVTLGLVFDAKSLGQI